MLNNFKTSWTLSCMVGFWHWRIFTMVGFCHGGNMLASHHDGDGDGDDGGNGFTWEAKSEKLYELFQAGGLLSCVLLCLLCRSVIKETLAPSIHPFDSFPTWFWFLIWSFWICHFPVVSCFDQLGLNFQVCWLSTFSWSEHNWALSHCSASNGFGFNFFGL